jgi:hypothetical protein
MRVLGLCGALGLTLSLVVGLAPHTPAAAAPSPRITMTGSASPPGVIAYTGSWSPTSRVAVRPTVSLPRRTSFVRGKLVVSQHSGTRWVAYSSVTSTRRTKVRASLPGGSFRLVYTARTSAKGRTTATRKVTYLAVVRGPKPAPPIVVIPPPAPTPPKLVQGASWHGQQFDDTQEPGRMQADTWFATRISNASPTAALARSHRGIVFPVVGFTSSRTDVLPSLPRAGRGWFVTTCVFDCHAFPMSGSISIQSGFDVASPILDADRPVMSGAHVVVEPGAVFDLARVAAHVDNPSARPLAAGTAAHVVLLDSAATPVYAFRSVTETTVAAAGAAEVALVPSGTTGFRWTPELAAAVASIEITLDPDP